MVGWFNLIALGQIYLNDILNFKSNLLIYVKFRIRQLKKDQFPQLKNKCFGSTTTF